MNGSAVFSGISAQDAHVSILSSRFENFTSYITENGKYVISTALELSRSGADIRDTVFYGNILSVYASGEDSQPRISVRDSAFNQTVADTGLYAGMSGMAFSHVIVDGSARISFSNTDFNGTGGLKYGIIAYPDGSRNVPVISVYGSRFLGLGGVAIVYGGILAADGIEAEFNDDGSAFLAYSSGRIPTEIYVNHSTFSGSGGRFLRSVSEDPGSMSAKVNDTTLSGFENTFFMYNTSLVLNNSIVEDEGVETVSEDGYESSPAIYSESGSIVIENSRISSESPALVFVSGGWEGEGLSVGDTELKDYAKGPASEDETIRNLAMSSMVYVFEYGSTGTPGTEECMQKYRQLSGGIDIWVPGGNRFDGDGDGTPNEACSSTQTGCDGVFACHFKLTENGNEVSRYGFIDIG